MKSAAAIHRQVEDLLASDPLEYEARLSAFARDGDLERAISADSCRYYRYLNALARVTKPKTVLELGTFNGGSALFVLLGLGSEGKIVSVDMNEQFPAWLAPVKDDPRLRLVCCDTADEASVKKVGIKSVDILIIDTLHTYEQVAREWQLFGPLLKKGGVVVVDDLMLADVGRFWKELTLDKIDTGGRYHWTGFGIAVKS